MIVYQWNGEAMLPVRGFEKRCDEQFCIGQRYHLEVREERSAASHNHYFAALQTAWANLPDDLVERFPTVEHLRKFALVKCGYADERSIVCASKAEAQRVAAFMKPMDDFAVVVVRDAVVSAFTAKSQSTRAMDRRTFADSKDKVLEFIAALIGTTARELATNEAA